MNKKLFYIAISIIITSCSSISVSEVNPKQQVSFHVPELQVIDDIASPIQTKTTINQDNKVVWVSTDSVGIYPASGSQVYFSLSGDAGKQTTTFDGGGWAFKEGMVYYSYYPFIGDMYLNRENIPVSFEGQAQIGITGIDHIGKCTYMRTEATRMLNGSLFLSYKYLACVIRPNLYSLPNGTYTKLAITTDADLFVKKGHFDLTSDTIEIIPDEKTNQLVIDLKNFEVNSSNTIQVYLVSAPVDLRSHKVTISILDDKKVERQCEKTINNNYIAGNIGGITCGTVQYPWAVVEQSMNLIVEDWNEGSETHGDLQ